MTRTTQRDSVVGVSRDSLSEATEEAILLAGARWPWLSEVEVLGAEKELHADGGMEYRVTVCVASGDPGARVVPARPASPQR